MDLNLGDIAGSIRGATGLCARRRIGRKVALRRLSAVFIITMLGVQVAAADSVKLGGFWIDDVIIDRISDGQILYVSSSGSEVSRPIEAIEGLRLTAYPALEQGVAQWEAGDLAGARRQLETVRNGATQQWVQHWASYRLLNVYDGLGEPVYLVDELARLGRGGAPAQYLAEVAIKSIEGADQTVLEDVIRRLEGADRGLQRGPQSEAIGAILERVKALEASAGAGAESVQPESGVQEEGGDAPRSDDNSAAASSTGEPEPESKAVAAHASGGIVMPAAIDRSDQVTRLIFSGQYTSAVQAAREALAKGGGKFAMRHYQQGVAQMAMAEADGGRDAYLDAGLSFMQVVVEYPTSVYAGPSLVELGFVHEKIGRADKAQLLYQKASQALDQEEEPRYVERLQQLRQAVGQ